VVLDDLGKKVRGDVMVLERLGAGLRITRTSQWP
jgi:hypothetical protein